MSSSNLGSIRSSIRNPDIWISVGRKRSSCTSEQVLLKANETPHSHKCDSSRLRDTTSHLFSPERADRTRHFNSAGAESARSPSPVQRKQNTAPLRPPATPKPSDYSAEQRGKTSQTGNPACHFIPHFYTELSLILP